MASTDIIEPLPNHFLIDSHCHLDYLQRDGVDIDLVIDNAKKHHVKAMVTISTSRKTWDDVIAIAARYDNVFASVGIHPHQSEGEYDMLNEDILYQYCQHEKVVAIGETGLDYYYNHSKKDVQINSFKTHINVARQTGLPLIIHTRDADDDTCDILETEYKKGAFSGLIHCFSATQELATRMLDIGFYISLSGIITFNKAQDLRDIVTTIPLDRILVETDSPFLAPIPKRGKQNEPAFTYYTAQKVADIKQESLSEIARVTTDNCNKIFTKMRF